MFVCMYMLHVWVLTEPRRGLWIIPSPRQLEAGVTGNVSPQNGAGNSSFKEPHAFLNVVLSLQPLFNLIFETDSLDRTWVLLF